MVSLLGSEVEISPAQGRSIVARGGPSVHHFGCAEGKRDSSDRCDSKVPGAPQSVERGGQRCPTTHPKEPAPLRKAASDCISRAGAELHPHRIPLTAMG